jgi:hypothetical protein
MCGRGGWPSGGGRGNSDGGGAWALGRRRGVMSAQLAGAACVHEDERWPRSGDRTADVETAVALPAFGRPIKIRVWKIETRGQIRGKIVWCKIRIVKDGNGNLRRWFSDGFLN